MGRGPVCGIMTRRGGGPAGAAGATGASGWAEATTGSVLAGTGSTGGADTTGDGTVAACSTTGAGAGCGATTGFAWLGAAATCGAAATGRSTGWDVDAGGCAGAATTGGRAMTGPTGGLVAMAGAGGGATILAPWRGNGTMRRGAIGVPCDGAEAGAEEGAAATRWGIPVAGTVDGGATTAAVGRGGAALMAASACLRSRIALSASPGFDTFERSNFGLVSVAGLFALTLRLPPLK